jgi:hypothetical protein
MCFIRQTRKGPNIGGMCMKDQIFLIIIVDLAANLLKTNPSKTKCTSALKSKKNE